MSNYFVEFGTTPYEEDCAQIGIPDFIFQARAEAQRFIEFLKVKFPNAPEGIRFRIHWNEHDFGSYPQIRIYYNESDVKQIAYANFVDEFLPAKWTDTDPIDWTTTHTND